MGGVMGMGTGPATETSWSGAALGTTCNTGQTGVQSGVLMGRGWWMMGGGGGGQQRFLCYSDERGTHACQRVTQAASGRCNC